MESFLKDDKWISGPQFLMLPEEQWPSDPDMVKEPAEGDDPEIKAVLANAVCVRRR